MFEWVSIILNNLFFMYFYFLCNKFVIFFQSYSSIQVIDNSSSTSTDEETQMKMTKKGKRKR